MSTMSEYLGFTADTTLADGRTRQTGGGFWARAMAAIAAAREVQAKREANRFLARQSDRFLRDIGMSEGEIFKLRHDDVI